MCRACELEKNEQLVIRVGKYTEDTLRTGEEWSHHTNVCSLQFSNLGIFEFLIIWIVSNAFTMIGKNV